MHPENASAPRVPLSWKCNLDLNSLFMQILVIKKIHSACFHFVESGTRQNWKKGVQQAKKIDGKFSGSQVLNNVKYQGGQFFLLLTEK